jgi:TonB-linked SusC/RagA family outer membrane protein
MFTHTIMLCAHTILVFSFEFSSLPVDLLAGSQKTAAKNCSELWTATHQFKPKILMKKCLLKLLVLLLASAPAVAQTVSGRVTNSADGSALPGVSVLVKGTNVGTTSDADGRYSINASEPTSILVFSFIGYATQEVQIGNRTTIDVNLEEDVTQLGEVVVTALGIERETKALGYSVTNVKGEEFTKAREINVANALVGKIAGVNSSAPSTGPGGSSRVTIRGNSSLNFDNQPLYVINGIQMNNDNLGSAGTWGGADMGDGISSINPDDIEDITVLKGGSAAALYGQRGRNGVILITTKSGKARQGLGIEFNSNTTFDKANNFTDWQTEYGQGTQGNKPVDVASAKNTAFSAWGPKLDGSSVPGFDGEDHPYSYVSKDNFKNFYQTGHTYTNTLSISGGSEAGSFRFSVGSLRNSSVYRNSEYNRTTANLDVNYKLSPKWSGKANLNYTKEDGNRSNLSDSPGNGNYAILFLPPNFDASLLAPGYDALTKREIEFNNTLFDTNPYFAANRFKNNTNKNRILSVGSLRYSPMDWLYVQARVANDFFAFNQESITPTGTAYRQGGGLDAQNTLTFNETNADILVGVNKDLNQDLSIGVTAGGNILKQESKNITLSAGNLAFPFLYNPSTAVSRNPNVSQPQKEVHSIYGAVELSYKDMLFLNLTDRNDWSSTLPAENNSYNYPSANLAFVFSEIVESSVVTFGKVRAGYAKVGGDAPAFYTKQYYSTNGAINGQPLGNLDNVIPNTKLEPLQVTELEIGTNLQFLDNRIFFDAAWYHKQTLNDIVRATVSQTSGFDVALVNVAKLENKGIELMIGGSPIKTADFTWTSTFNYTNNKSNIVALAEGQTENPVEGATSRTLRGNISNIVGEPFAQVMVYDYLRDDNGNLIVNASGFPQAAATPTAAGTGIHPITGGWNNDFKYKNLSLAFLIDFKSGAVIYSGTNSVATGAGLHKQTLVGREEGVTVTGVNEAGAPVTTVIPAQNYYGSLGAISKNFIQDADFVKLRSVSLTYNFPTKLLGGKVNALSLSLVGRNLFYISKKTDNIDPESNYTNGNGQGLEFAALPTVRTMGFNLNVKF